MFGPAVKTGPVPKSQVDGFGKTAVAPGKDAFHETCEGIMILEIDIFHRVEDFLKEHMLPVKFCFVFCPTQAKGV